MTIVDVAGVQLNVAALTDPGLKRDNNEDSYLTHGAAYVVADGMGGYEAGELASAAVIDAFREQFKPGQFGDFAAVQAALLDADDRVATVAGGTERGAGSTATGLILVEHEAQAFWLVFNVGDSRVYRHFHSELEQLTTDHSLGRELVDTGQMAAEDLATFKERNVITRAIGASDSLADSWLIPVVNGERLLVCSDGLHGEVDDETIRAIMTMNGKTETVVRALVDRAKANGGRDNVTVVVIDVISGGGAVDTDPVTAAMQLDFSELDDTLTA